jgi:hypothetical protein
MIRNLISKVLTSRFFELGRVRLSNTAQALIGHDSEEVHSDYITVGREALRAAVDRFPIL